MALENVMRVDSGHIVTGGGAGGSSVEIDWEDWCELTPEEQETGDWTIVNCPWADGNVSIDLMTKLWENPNPSASFAAQDIVVDLTGYDLIIAIATNGVVSMQINSVGNGLNLNEAATSNGSSNVPRRRLGTITSTGISWDVGYQSGTASGNVCIPYQIYGIKLTASVKINAIAMDVSTSADKCMLSDGVTSVEDMLTDNYKTYTIPIGGTITIPFEDSFYKSPFILAKAERTNRTSVFLLCNCNSTYRTAIRLDGQSNTISISFNSNADIVITNTDTSYNNTITLLLLGKLYA